MGLCFCAPDWILWFILTWNLETWVSCNFPFLRRKYAISGCGSARFLDFYRMKNERFLGFGYGEYCYSASGFSIEDVKKMGPSG